MKIIIHRTFSTLLILTIISIVGCSGNDKPYSTSEKPPQFVLATSTTNPRTAQSCETNAVPPICGLIPGQSTTEVKVLLGEPDYTSQDDTTGEQWYDYFDLDIGLSFKKNRLKLVRYKPKELVLGEVIRHLSAPDMVDLVVAGLHSGPEQALNRSHLFWLERGVVIRMRHVLPYWTDMEIGIVEYFQPMSEKKLRDWWSSPRSFEKTIEWPGFEK